MNAPQRSQEIDGLHAERLRLEEQAEIAAAMTRARKDPLRDISKDETDREILDNAFRRIRQQTRDAYFSVQNEQLRKRLIATARQIERQEVASILGEVAAAEQVRAQTFARAALPWMLRVLSPAFGAVLGYFLKGVTGAVVGGIAGLIFGVYMAQAENEINKGRFGLENGVPDEYLQDLTFGDQEERSGQRDRMLDPESALRSRDSLAREHAKGVESRRGRGRWEKLRDSPVVRFVAIALIGLGALLAYVFRD